MRRTSDVTDTQFPFASDRVPFILVVGEPSGVNDIRKEDLVTQDGRGFDHASTREKKFALVNRAYDLREQGVACTLLAVWPGKTRSDVFEVDDLSHALGNMGATPEVKA